MENPIAGFHFFVEIQGAVEAALTYDALGLVGLLSAHDQLPEETQAAVADIKFLDAEGRKIDPVL